MCGWFFIKLFNIGFGELRVIQAIIGNVIGVEFGRGGISGVGDFGRFVNRPYIWGWVIIRAMAHCRYERTNKA